MARVRALIIIVEVWTSIAEQSTDLPSVRRRGEREIAEGLKNSSF
jgi:hypothetical protein